ncbi:dihydroorotate dehydrogenase [Streptomyces sulphureus]|uniref:dihydroorotate dehydrogenase n=1 Tax=Streptomyces sulphureus TaxID=47758 RepID=UPI00039B5220|nr:dihydroorotate dehydrogenase [Streptomyces sulphureus]
MADDLVGQGAVLDDRDRMFACSPTGSASLAVRVGGLELANPVMPASGCFGPELGGLLPVRDLGAVVTKTLFDERRSGNPSHRLTETSHGMLNSVGIPSPGTSKFLAEVLPQYRAFGIPVVVSTGGLTVEEYWQVTSDLEGAHVDALEINVSCPNLEHGGLAIGTDPAVVEKVVRGVAARTTVPLWVKLTPNVTSIGAIARAAEDAGATAVTVCNSFPAMAVDVRRRRAVLGNGTGGLSGPAIKPLALRLVHEASSAVTIPVIGCGGIASARDVAEFLLAGASAVQIGTASFTRPFAMAQIVRDLAALADDLDVSHINKLTSGLQTEPSLETQCPPSKMKM